MRLTGRHCFCAIFKSNTATLKNCFFASIRAFPDIVPPTALAHNCPRLYSPCLRGTWSVFSPDYLLWGRSLIKVPWSGKWWSCRWYLLFLAFLSCSVWRYNSLAASGRRRQAIRCSSFVGFHLKMCNFNQELCSMDGLSVRAVEMLWPVLC